MKNSIKKYQVIHKAHDIIKGHMIKNGIKIEVSVPLCNPQSKIIVRNLSEKWNQVNCPKCLRLK